MQKLITPGAKITPLDSEKLKFIAKYLNTSQSKVIQNWIRAEYKRLKQIEKDNIMIV